VFLGTVLCTRVVISVLEKLPNRSDEAISNF
jgi:hypothetical protein